MLTALFKTTLQVMLGHKTITKPLLIEAVSAIPRSHCAQLYFP